MQHGSPRDWVMIAVLALIGGSGILLRSGTIQSLRPEMHEALWTEPGQAGRAPARLWDDPLGAVERHRRALAAQASALAELKRQEERKDEDPGAISQARADSNAAWKALVDSRQESFDVLVCPMNGSALPGAEQGRIDNRLAIIAALGESGYVATDVSSIQYFAYTDVASHGDENVVTETVVPYEWFRHEHLEAGHDDDRHRPYVLVLWMRADLFPPGEQLLAIKRLARSLEEPLKGDDEAAEKPRLRILGPNGSNALVDLVVEDLRRAKDKGDDHSLDLRLLAFNPTIAQAPLREALEDRIKHLVAAGMYELKKEEGETPADVAGRVAGALEPGGRYKLASMTGSLTRMIGTDQWLADALARELELRRRLPRSDEASVVLIHESDTKYSRAWPAAFTSAAVDVSEGRIGRFAEPIRSYQYVRGLDGRVSERPATTQTPLVEERADPLRPSASPSPVGRARLDYVSRMIERIDHDLDADGVRASAIGVIGTDIYDKLVLIDAIRRRFPGILVFTTDLDARFSDPAVYETTRNMIVASHFGLRLGTLQERTAPFRSGYQTALFLTVRCAVDGHAPAFSDARETRVYEIGRTGAYDLVGQEATELFPQARRTVHRIEPWLTAVLLLIGGFAMAVLARYAVGAWLAMDDNAWSRLVDTGLMCYLVFWAAPVVCWWWIASTASTNYGAEPMLWLEGISAWPVVLLRLIVICGVGWLLIRAHFSLRANAATICRAYALPGFKRSEQGRDPLTRMITAAQQRYRDRKLRVVKALDELLGEGSVIRRGAVAFRDWSHRRGIVAWYEQPAPADVRFKAQGASGARLWREYLRRGRPIDRTARALILLAAYFVVLLVIRQMSSDTGGYSRGDAAQVLGLASSVGSLVLVNFLMFVVWDATWLSRRFLGHLASGERTWSDETLAHVRQEGVPAKAAHWWLMMRLIAMRTEATGAMIAGPFVLLLLLLASTSGYFDLWVWSLFDVAVLFGIATLVIVTAAGLRRDAERARTKAINEVTNLHMQATLDGADEQERTALAETIERIRGLRTGALAPWSQNAALRAALIPFSGFGIVQIVEVLGR